MLRKCNEFGVKCKWKTGIKSTTVKNYTEAVYAGKIFVIRGLTGNAKGTLG